MKRVIFILPLIFLFGIQAMAKDVIYHRHRDCFIGCGETTKTRKETEDRIITIINCTGVGFSSCPGGIAYPTPPGITDFEASAINDRVDFAQNKMDDGVLNGSDSKTFYNTDTEQYWVYSVEWTRTVNDQGEPEEENVKVYRKKIEM